MEYVIPPSLSISILFKFFIVIIGSTLKTNQFHCPADVSIFILTCVKSVTA